MLGVPEVEGQLPCSEPALALVSLMLFTQAEAVYADLGRGPAVDKNQLDQVVDEFLAYIARLEAAAPEVVATLDLEALQDRIQKYVLERAEASEAAKGATDADQR